MQRKEADRLIKRYQLEHLVPLILTIFSVYVWFVSLQAIPLKIMGLFLNVMGLLIWWSAKITLGENWDGGYGQPKIRKLVTWGIYSKISHPLYWGVNLTLVGIALISQKIWITLVVLVIIIYFFNRMTIEDKYLSKKLEKKYLNYKKGTWI